jgi:hypothetical protein
VGFFEDRILRFDWGKPLNASENHVFCLLFETVPLRQQIRSVNNYEPAYHVWQLQCFDRNRYYKQKEKLDLLPKGRRNSPGCFGGISLNKSQIGLRPCACFCVFSTPLRVFKQHKLTPPSYIISSTKKRIHETGKLVLNYKLCLISLHPLNTWRVIVHYTLYTGWRAHPSREFITL